MKQDSSRNAAYVVDCEDYVHVVEFNPFECGDEGTLIAYGGNNYVVIGTCRFQEEEAEVEGILYKTLRTFHHGIRVDAIAWSPESRVDALPPQIRFCTAAADRKLRVFSSDLQDKNEYKVIEGHSDYINDLVFAPKDGQEVASVSDDHTCRPNCFPKKQDENGKELQFGIKYSTNETEMSLILCELFGEGVPHKPWTKLFLEW
uniref:Nucleoporin 37 n=1 Tax=Ornithorhynchus anatinus TaxID=9258 RepID=A0A6I8NXE6_ORNAN